MRKADFLLPEQCRKADWLLLDSDELKDFDQLIYAINYTYKHQETESRVRK